MPIEYFHIMNHRRFCNINITILKKGKNMRKLSIVFLIMLTSACTSLKVVETNSKTGYFPGNKTADVVKSVKIDLDSLKDIVLVPNGDFTSKMVKNIGYFNTVMTFEDLETAIIKNDLTDKVPSLNDRIGLNKAAKAYKKFLWLRWDTRTDGSSQYKQLILTDPITLEDLFIAETYLDHVWAGVSDQKNWYPIMNSLIDYLKENSATYGK